MENLNIDQKTLLWLSKSNISNKQFTKLLDYFGTLRELWDNFEDEKNNLTLFKTNTINKLHFSKRTIEETIFRLKAEGAEIVTVYDENYPKRLKNVENSPYLLYYKGNLKNINNTTIAVVGSRKATSYGKWATEKLCSELAQLGVNIVSGLAMGIDTIAHKTALKYNALTFGVIGCGINVVYPKKNLELYKQLFEKGAVITEYSLDMQPLAFNFHDRNRIISGLSDGVLVIEAQEKSGTLITAGHGANQGREIFAVPGNIDSLYSKGTNLLIKDGAKITTSIDDIVEEILELKEKTNHNRNFDYSKLTDDELKIIDCLKSGENTIEKLSVSTKMETGFILSNLTLLEMKGAITVSANKIILQK